MCGILGLINFNKRQNDEELVVKMSELIRHRGPDGEGFLFEKDVSLAHRRLAIIDLSQHGHQPMRSSEGRYSIVFNGEIYNFEELKKQLEGKGHVFKSRSDTEVLLNGYIEWGAEIVKKLNGMFAFAIWDNVDRSVFLARDRYGVKPLYYWWSDSNFVFSSEIKPILIHPEYKFNVDKDALLEYFTFQNFFTAKTLFNQVSLFPAGHWAKVYVDKPALKPVEYWDYSFEEPTLHRSEEDYLEELDALFHQAVKRQLISDVPVGSYLSGGLDSGSITAMASKSIPNMNTFTCGFDLRSASGMELAYDEREKAEFMSYKFKTEHYEMVLKSGDMEKVMKPLVYHLEEPRVGQSYPNYCVAKLASKFVKVVLSGTGGDELFGGYPWRYFRAGEKVQGFENYIDQYYQFWQRLIPNKTVSKVFSPIWPEVQHLQTRDIFKNVFNQKQPKTNQIEDLVNHSLYFEAKTFLHGLLVVEDKLSMAFGLETRVPFLDNDLVDFAMKLPVKLKIKNLGQMERIDENELAKRKQFFDKTNEGKYLLRSMLSKHVPTEISQGAKQGFSAPDGSWFKGESMRFVQDLIGNKNAKIYNYMNFTETSKLIDDHLSGRFNRRLLIWSLLNFETWLGTFEK